MTEKIYDSKGKELGFIQNSNLVWTCDEAKGICTTDNSLSASETPQPKKKSRLDEECSVTEIAGGPF